MKLPYHLRSIVTTIIRIVPTERIVLLGYFDRCGKAWSVFSGHPVPAYPIRAANILVITKNEQLQCKLIEKLELRCNTILSVTCNVFSLHKWTKLAENGCEFVSTILNNDCTIYLCPNAAPVHFAEENATRYIEKQNKEIEIWYRNGVSFLKMACTQHLAGNYRILAFCLHQAAEQFLIMLIQATTGMRFGTHNLMRMLRFMRFYNSQIRHVFKPASEEEHASICLLRETYIKARYKVEFEMTDTQIQYLISELGKLQQIARDILQRYQQRVSDGLTTVIDLPG